MPNVPAEGAYLYFTRDGTPLGPPLPAPPGANDLHVAWGPGGLLVWWTKNGRPVGPPIPAPPGANDAHLRNIESSLGGEFQYQDISGFPTGTPMLTGDEMLAAGAQRGAAILQIIGGSVKLVDREGRPEFQLELTSSVWSSLSLFEIESVSDAYARLNRAISDGYIEVKPGFDSLKLMNLEKGLHALAPGVFDPRVAGGRVRGQWLPPGIVISLTKAETDELVALIGTGAGIGGFLEKIGVVPPWVGVVAKALALAGAAIKLAQSLSKNGTVGLKVWGWPPIIYWLPIPT